MATAASTPAFRAIEQQLKTLCLREFPCGSGPWRDEELVHPGKKNIKGQKKTVLTPLKKKEKSATDLDTVKRLAQKEKSEVLQELVNSHFSPWHLDYSWSEEAKELREIAVKSPWLIDANFVLNYFKTLRIVDKDITSVDQKLLRLNNLEELTLSANFITNVNSKNLPQSLKVLELCANNISDISSLCVRPPLLRHLGLGRNCVSFIGDYLTGDYWPNLLSLDLSHNNLCDLMEIIRKMTTLPKLRNLILQGNPLSLVPGYRGYTIDCLRRLTVLDDIHISADEKHHFKGLARRREFILDEAKVQINVSYIKGLPCPEEIKHPENQPEFPVVERTYFIQFMFPEETGLKPEEVPVDVAALADDMADMATETGEGVDTARQEEAEEQSTRRDSPTGHKENQEQKQLGSSVAMVTAAASQQERNVLFDSRPQLKSAAPAASSVASFPQAKPNLEDPEIKPGPDVEGINLDLLTDNQQPGEGEDGDPTNRTDEPTPRIKLAPINSEPKPWSEELQLDWSIDLVRDDLLTLRDFFKQGMDFTVVEQVVLGYPVEPDTATTDEKDKESSKEKKKEKGAKGKRKTPEPPKKSPSKSIKDTAKPDKGGKKKKELEIELIRSPPTYTTIAAFHITLEPFLEGEFLYQNIFTKGDVPPPSTVRSSFLEDQKADKKDKKKLDKSDKSDKSPDKKKERRKSVQGKEEVSKKGSKGGRHAEEAEEDDLPPPPLELEVSVRLHHWLTATDSVREEEEKAAKALIAAATTRSSVGGDGSKATASFKH
ncbi:hypothetical protein EGW08_020865 [Elysia chlorotica]|uniref:Leucine-rich repeat-containing protein 43 n=1 Tax=Elysia chlorotica TaxID=188477 RepID=A0A433SQF6_ELYCH|nr:hypothetical protein EGW08_020865 [Elysia chlorotica]